MSESQATEPEDEVTTAVKIAKAYVRKVWKSENIQNLGLEEITHESGSTWRITVGFSRPWDSNDFGHLSIVLHRNPPARTYKSVIVNTRTEEVQSVSNRETESRR